MRTLVLLTLLVVGSGCAAPASVQGVFHNQDFSVTCLAPQVNRIESSPILDAVFAQTENDRMRTVVLTLDPTQPLGAGGTIALDGLQAQLTVSEGALVVETVSDGRTITSSKNATHASSTTGNVVLTSLEPLSGRFAVDLDDGGHLEGVFDVDTQP